MLKQISLSTVILENLQEMWKKADIIPRDYQISTILSSLKNLGKLDYSQDCFSSYSENRELLVAPTASGKTIMAISIASLYTRLGLPVLFVVHRDRLLNQTKKVASKMGISTGIIAGSRKENRDGLLQIASFQALANGRDISWFDPSLVEADEAHYTSFTGVLSQTFPNLPSRKPNEPNYLGITATPFRLDPRESMGDKFNSVTLAPMPLELIKQGYICGGSYYSIETENNKDKNTCSVEHIYDQWKRLASDRTTISFSSRVSRAVELAEYFSSKGVKSAYVDGSVSISKREKLYSQLEKGKIQFIASCLALNEGFDCPCVDALIFDKFTVSLASYIQSLGRGSRIYKGKQNFIVLDATGVVRELRYLETFRVDESCLDPKPNLPKSQAPLKICPNCKQYIFLSVMTCSCGYKFTHKPRIKQEDKPLVKLFWGADESRRYAYWIRLTVQAKKKFGEGFDLSSAWVDRLYYEKFGEYPPTDWKKYIAN